MAKHTKGKSSTTAKKLPAWFADWQFGVLAGLFNSSMSHVLRKDKSRRKLVASMRKGTAKSLTYAASAAKGTRLAKAAEACKGKVSRRPFHRALRRGVAFAGRGNVLPARQLSRHAKQARYALRKGDKAKLRKHLRALRKGLADIGIAEVYDWYDPKDKDMVFFRVVARAFRRLPRVARVKGRKA